MTGVFLKITNMSLYFSLMALSHPGAFNANIMCFFFTQRSVDTVFTRARVTKALRTIKMSETDGVFCFVA